LAHADVYSYVDWTEADVALGTAKGTITLPDQSTVTVTFKATQEDGSAGNLFGAQVDPGTNYWMPAEPFISAEVENAPPDSDILQLQGGQNETYTVTLSEPIKDPIMAILSLGQFAVPTTYDFDSPFVIVSQGVGYFGGSATALRTLPDDVLEGSEGHGTIKFTGTFETFSWTVPTPEAWHGFTFGIRTTERLEPTEEAGAPSPSGGSSNGGGDNDGNDDDAGVVGKTKNDPGCDCKLSSEESLGSAGAVFLALAMGVARRRGKRVAN
jgi:hypothetical protein